jgi:hypothetical protein
LKIVNCFIVIIHDSMTTTTDIAICLCTSGKQDGAGRQGKTETLAQSFVRSLARSRQTKRDLHASQQHQQQQQQCFASLRTNPRNASSNRTYIRSNTAAAAPHRIAGLR